MYSSPHVLTRTWTSVRSSMDITSRNTVVPIMGCIPGVKSKFVGIHGVQSQNLSYLTTQSWAGGCNPFCFVVWGWSASCILALFGKGRKCLWQGFLFKVRIISKHKNFSEKFKPLQASKVPSCCFQTFFLPSSWIEFSYFCSQHLFLTLPVIFFPAQKFYQRTCRL